MARALARTGSGRVGRGTAPGMVIDGPDRDRRQRDLDEELLRKATRPSALWVLVTLGLLLLLVMLIFVAQNGHRADFQFLWLEFSLPVGLAMLFSAVVGALAVVLVGAGRLVRFRLAARRRRRQPDEAVTGSELPG